MTITVPDDAALYQRVLEPVFVLSFNVVEHAERWDYVSARCVATRVRLCKESAVGRRLHLRVAPSSRTTRT